MKFLNTLLQMTNTKQDGAVPVAEWLRPLIFSARHLTAVGSSLAQVTCGTSQVLLAGGQVHVPFSLHLTIDSAQNE